MISMTSVPQLDHRAALVAMLREPSSNDVQYRAMSNERKQTGKRHNAEPNANAQDL